MLNYNKNKLINRCLEEYYNTFSLMLDTRDFVPDKYNNKIQKYIFKNMKKMFKRLNREDRKYQRLMRKKQRRKRCAVQNMSSSDIVEIADKDITHVEEIKSVVAAETAIADDKGIAVVPQSEDTVLAKAAEESELPQEI